MNWRDRIGVFVLTREEQRTIAFVILALVLGLATLHYRQARPHEGPNDKQEPVAAPSRGNSR